MVKITCSLKELQEKIGDVNKEELEETLFDMGFELESLEGDALTVEVTAERPDLLSTQGLARALAGYIGIKHQKKYEAKKSAYSILVNESVKKVRPYTAAAVIKNISLNDQKVRELILVQEKLHATFERQRKKGAIGIYPLEKITFPITYTAEDPQKVRFVPLGADEEMTGEEVLEKHPTGRQYAHLLTEQKQYPFFIDAQGSVLSMPPIINSEQVGKVTEETKELFIECSGFDEEHLSRLLNILVTLLADMGGEIYTVTVQDEGKKKVFPRLEEEKRSIHVEQIRKTLGIDVTVEETKELLEKMLYTVHATKKDELFFSVPPFRQDIWHDIDIIDDVARAYGFSHFKPCFSHVETIGETTKTTKLREEVQTVFVGLQYQEAATLSLTSKEDQFVKMNLLEQEHVQLGESTEKSINMIRFWLLPEVIKTLVHNRSKEYPQRIFEITYVIEPDKERDVLSKNVLKLSFVSAHEHANFTEAKQVIEYFFTLFGMQVSLEEENHPSFIHGRCACILWNKKKVGFFGEIHPSVLSNWNLDVPTVGCEIDCTTLFALEKAE